MQLHDHITATLRGHGIQKTPKAFIYVTELAEQYLLPFAGQRLSDLLADTAARHQIQVPSLRRELLFLSRRIRQSDPQWYRQVFDGNPDVFALVRAIALEALEHSRLVP